MSRFDNRRTVIARTMVWQRGEQDGWDKYLIREQANRPPIISQLTVVHPDVPVCLACLSSDVVMVDSVKYRHGELYCRQCGVTYGILL